jgi:hypothetical protein
MADIEDTSEIYSVSTETAKVNVSIRELSTIRGVVTEKEIGVRKNKDEVIMNIIQGKLSSEVEGKCGENGYTKPGSVNVITISSGYCRDNYISFDVIYESMVCSPVEGMIIECMAKEITESAGIRAELDDENDPLKIYIARDHHIKNDVFNSIEVGDKIKVRVFGTRYELNDRYISVIVQLLSKV